MSILLTQTTMEPFEALDFYDIESLLTEEEIMVRDMVRDWVDEEVLPKIEHACEECKAEMEASLFFLSSREAAIANAEERIATSAAPKDEADRW